MSHALQGAGNGVNIRVLRRLIASAAIRARIAAVKILLITGEYPPQPGGVGDYTRRLARSLAARGHALYVATIQGGSFVVYDLATDRQSPIISRPSSWGWRIHRH